MPKPKFTDVWEKGSRMKHLTIAQGKGPDPAPRESGAGPAVLPKQ